MSGITKHSLGNQTFGDVTADEITADEITVDEITVDEITPTKVLGHFHALILPGLAITASQSNGVVVESTGQISFSVNDLLYLFLDGFIPTEFLGSKVRIDTLTLWCNTSQAAGDIDLIEIWDTDIATGVGISAYSADPHLELEGAGDHITILSPTLELTNQHSYYIRLTFSGLGGPSICLVTAVELVCSLI